MLLDHPPKGQGAEAIFRWASDQYGPMAEAQRAYRAAKKNDPALIRLRADLAKLNPPITAGGFDGFAQVVGKLHSPAAGRISEIKEAIRHREAEIHREHFPADADAAGAARFSRDAA